MFNVQLVLWLCALLLAACGEGHEQMLRQLEELERQNRADSVMTNDSLAEALTRYFDHHGTPNERMRAHYILGRTYADMGEAPRAVDAYLDAADCTDTTTVDCDFRTLGCVYSQMGDVYYRQLLLSNAIEARKKSCHYAKIAGDTLGYITELKLSAGAYILLNKRDSAEMLLKKALRQYEECGYSQESIQSSLVLMHLYMDEPEHLSDLGRLIEKYDSGSNLFDENHELPPYMNLYYYYKGRYWEYLNQLDSAELYYRKVYHPNMAFTAQNSMYKGLLSVFQKRHQADSIAKYAQLYCQVNDSSIALNDQQLIAQMSATYQYNRFQKQAFESEKKADRERLRLYILLIVAFLLALAGITAFILFKKRKLKAIHQLTGSLTVSRAEQQNVKLELEKLKSKNYDELIIEKERKEQELELRIVSLEREIGQSEGAKPQNRFTDFKNSQIVNVFGKKAHFTKDHPVPNKSEWNTLVGQFREDLPATYQFFFDGKKLSPLELYTCILLILDFEEGAIVGLTQTSNAAVSNAKSRANQKLFNEKSAVTLKYNLKSIV